MPLILFYFYMFKRSIYYFLISINYQKIDKYKWKYRENIFIGKLPMDFTD
jgi:hypothetical protein